MNIGWECPKCGSVYAPTVQKCWNCPRKPEYEIGTTPWWQKYGMGTVSTTSKGQYTINFKYIDPEDPDEPTGVAI